jgi:hypothetical protein
MGLLGFAGCGGGDPFSYASVKGKVTYDDGSLIPAHRITVIFKPDAPPLDPMTHPKPGFAEVNEADGTFDTSTITSSEHGQGLVVGTHKVGVRTTDANDSPTKDVDEKYKDPVTSGIVVDTSKTPFEIKVPRPAKK